MFCRYYNYYDECAEDNLATFAVAPSRERGLKSSSKPKEKPNSGRSFAGAWIEMPLQELIEAMQQCRSFAGAWIEIHIISGK